MRPSNATAVVVFLAALSVVGCGGVTSSGGGTDGGDGPVSASERPVDVGDTATESAASAADTSTGGLEAGDASTDTNDASTSDADTDASVLCPVPETFVGSMTTVTCPPVAAAVAGVVTPTCEFPHALAPNLAFTGPVKLVSHLDRDFGDFDINPIGDGRIQLMCVYNDPDGNSVGGIYRFLFASSCTASSAAGFTCTK